MVQADHIAYTWVVERLVSNWWKLLIENVLEERKQV